jgi:hypothetical protein
MMRRSKRLIEYNKKQFNEITEKISNYIREVTIEINSLERVIIIIKIYELVINEFTIISNYNPIYNFLYSLKEKSLEIREYINESTIQKKTYNSITKILNLFDKKYDEYIDIQLPNMNILTHKHPILSEKEECPICMEIIHKKNGITTQCKHNFHKICLITHINTNKNCPMCRSLIKL